MSTPSGAQGDNGFTLVEVVVTLTILLMSLAAASGAFLSSQRAHRESVSTLRVAQAMRETLETLRAAPFDQLVTTYQDSFFAVQGLEATGVIQLFVDETATGTADTAALGLPRDLDGDGLATTPDVTLNYLLMPVKLQITWTENGAQQTQVHYSYLASLD